MAVEKMYMMSLIGRLEDLDSVLTDVICSGRISLTNALNQIEQDGLIMEVANEDLDKKVDFNYVTTISKNEALEEWLNKAKRLKEIFSIEIDEEAMNRRAHLNPEEIDVIYADLEADIGYVQGLQNRLSALDEIEKNYRLVQGLDVPIEELRNMEYFDYRFGRLSSEHKEKLRKYDDKLLASVFQIQARDGNDVFLTVYPKKTAMETDRILRSLNWNDIHLDPAYEGTIDRILEEIQRTREELTEQVERESRRMISEREAEREKYKTLISNVFAREKTEQLSSLVASGSRYFYITGWVPQSDAREVKTMFSRYEDILLKLSEPEEHPGLVPPTRLKNNRFFEPFEVLVKMYGAPNYFEIDPTPFFGITYMLLFGMMFGDVGQGIVIALFGWLASKRFGQFGRMLTRIGLASTVFGFLYGSVFCIETIIPALLIRPFQEINTALVGAIVFGVLLSSSSYIFGIMNSLKRKDLEEALFGKEGVAGLLLLWSALLLVLSSVLGIQTLPKFLLIAIIVLSIVAIVGKQPLTHLIEGKRPLHKDAPSSYYVENGFALIETIIAMLSGTISFVRVGAFAINHTGLFLAFETIGHMIGTSGGMIGMIILGNIIIIGLEGLIVFIQGLRLEFYELFSKYYKGDGVAFEPVTNKK